MAQAQKMQKDMMNAKAEIDKKLSRGIVYLRRD